MTKKIILVFKTHFDIGFTDLAKNVTHGYGNAMLREVIETCRATEHLGALRYVWTMPAWPLYYIIEHGDPALLPELDRLIENGQIVWHALPFTSHTDCCAPEEYAAALQYARLLSERYHKPLPVAGKMTDVPGHGLMLPELLSQAGIRFLHLGCNEFATPPDVPRLFWWQSPQGGRVLTMYSKGGYGTTLLPPKDWPFPVWMALMHTADNCGPQTADIITGLAEKAKRAYPDAEIVCGTMDDFYRELAKCDLSAVPVVTKDLADTWIHGVGSYPKEVAALRENRRLARRLHRAYEKRLQDGGEPIPDWDALWAAYYAQIALFEEHTWGADTKRFLGQDRVYEKEDFLAARDTAPYRFMETSWEEQRTRMTRATECLHRIAALLPKLDTPEKPLLPLRTYLQDGQTVVEAGQYRLSFDPKTGVIASVEDLALHTPILQSRDGKGVFAYRYDRAGIEDVQTFLRRYGYRFTDWGVLDYGRVKYPECEHCTFAPVFDRVVVREDRIRFEYHTEQSAERYGDAERIVLTVQFPEEGGIDVALSLFGKQASPFIEAGSFILPLAEPSAYRLGRPCAVIDPATEIQRCANHSYYCLEDAAAAVGERASVTVYPLDTPLLAIGSCGLYEYEPEYPQGRAPELWFNLFNNMWGTNFPQWIEGDFTYRFTIRSAAPDAALKLSGPEAPAFIAGIPDTLELVTVQDDGQTRYLWLRDHSGKAGTATVRMPGATLTPTDLWRRPTGKTQTDELTFAVRPNGLCCLAISEKE